MTDTIKDGDFTFDALYNQIILPLFSFISTFDKRKGNKYHDLSDALKSGFALFALKSQSLFAFQKRSRAEQDNLSSIFGIGKHLSDNGIRTILDKVDPNLLSKGFQSLIKYLDERNILGSYKVLEKYLVVSIDGVEHFKSKKINCDCCLRRKHRDGSQSYYHCMLSAAIVNPYQPEVFIADNEPIIRQDGAVKNDCERNAAKRLFEKLCGVFSSKPIIYVLDALYSCAPILKLVSANPNWGYVANITEKGHGYLFEQFDGLNGKGRVEWKDFRKKRDRYTVGFVNGLALNKSNPEVTVNMIYCRFKPEGKPEKVFSWITNIPLTQSNIKTMIDIGRSRWKIENEVFNTLKNQEYNFEHNYGHGKENLSTNFAFLMMLAFTIDQIQQRCNRYFKSLHKGLVTRIKIWDATRSVFKIIRCESMTQLQAKILEMYQIRLI